MTIFLYFFFRYDIFELQVGQHMFVSLLDSDTLVCWVELEFEIGSE